MIKTSLFCKKQCWNQQVFLSITTETDKKNYFPTMLKKLNAMNIIIKSQIIKPENALV